MPAPPELGDSNFMTWLWGAFGAVFATMASGFVYLSGMISKVGRDGILLEIEKRFTTKEDLQDMERRIGQMLRDLMREHENNVARDINRRFTPRENL